MIKHVVCFKLKDQSQIDKAVEILNSMKGNVPLAVEVFAHRDFLNSPRSYDIILEVTLNSKGDLEAYQVDEYHVNVVKKFMHQVIDKSVAVDYEF